jgi:SAM-dependent methyltransferase
VTSASGAGISRVEERKRSFGAVAAAYERIRPGYPEQLFDDLLSWADPPLERVLEVGAGTGRATAVLVGRGLDVHAVEHDPAMAAVLQSRLPQVRLSVGGFETTPHDGPYDLVVSAQAWHWIDPDQRWSRAASLLRPGGTIGLFWNHDRTGDHEVGAALQEAHDRWTPGITIDYDLPGEDLAQHEAWPGRYPGQLDDFTGFETRHYHWQRTLSGRDYVELLSTMSAYNVRPVEARQALFAEVLDIVGAQIVLRMDTILDLARRR